MNLKIISLFTLKLVLPSKKDSSSSEIEPIRYFCSFGERLLDLFAGFIKLKTWIYEIEI